MSARIQSGQRGRVEALDLLRLLAALSVILYHYSFRGAAADGMTDLSLPALVPVTIYGYLGVQLFFVISGFVIAYSAEGRSARDFVIARAARIYPGFLACMTLTFLVTLAFGAPRFEASFVDWAANFVIVAPALKQPFMDGVYWSIVYELVFYSWMAGAIVLGLFPRRLTLIVALWLILSVANEAFLRSGALRHLFLTDASGFFSAGLLLYALFAGRRDILTWPLLLAASAIGAAQAIIDSNWVREHFGVVLSNAVIAGVSVGAVVLVGLALLPKRLPLPAGLIAALGGLTYPLYLLHENIGFIAFNRLGGQAAPGLLAAATIAAMLALSFAVWRFVERPGQKAMKAGMRAGFQWLAEKWTARRPPATAEASAANARPAPAESRADGAASIAVFGPVALPRARA